MTTAIKGQVLTEAIVENLADVWDADRGRLPVDQVRRIVVPNAVVDPGVIGLVLPTRLVQQLGLTRSQGQGAASGKGRVAVYEAVRLTLLERYCSLDVLEVPDDVPAMVGQAPLTMLDLMVNAEDDRLMANPAHKGEQVLEMYISWLRTMTAAIAAKECAKDRPPNGRPQPLLPDTGRTIPYTELPPGKPGDALYQEYETYRREVGRWLAEGRDGSFVLLKGQEVIGFYESWEAARAEGLRRYLPDSHMIKQILATEPVLRLRGYV